MGDRMLATDLIVGRKYVQRAKAQDAECPLRKIIFSVVRITVQDRPRRSLSLLSDRRYTPMDAGVRRCM